MILKHQRKSIRLKEYDYSQPGEYFITICTKDHECVFGAIINGKMNLNKIGSVERCWKGIPEHFSNVELDKYKKKVPRKAGQHSQASGCRIIFMVLLL
jgi:putative transposase